MRGFAGAGFASLFGLLICIIPAIAGPGLPSDRLNGY
jgi:hypothetical protein